MLASKLQGLPRWKPVVTGRPATAEMNEVIANVDSALRKFMSANMEDHFLVEGPCWQQLPSWHSSDGSRHDNFVALLCGCGPHAVRVARLAVGLAKTTGTRVAQPKARGRKRRWGSSSVIGQPPADQRAAAAAEQCLSPAATSVAVVLGRVMTWGLIHKVPDNVVTSLFAQLALAGVSMGHKYHHAAAVPEFARAARALMAVDLREQFWRQPPNCNHPSCWRLSCDLLGVS